MRQICVFLLFFTLTSCEYFNVKKTSTEAILKEELEAFNWNDVDEYPSFSVCDSLTAKQDKKQCFYQVLTSHISKVIQNENTTLSKDIEGTLIFKFKLSKTGILKLKTLGTTNTQGYKVKKAIDKSLDSLPQIFPATKRGQQVETEFQLPIIIKVN